jgi:hypothetical protein
MMEFWEARTVHTHINFRYSVYGISSYLVENARKLLLKGFHERQECQVSYFV